MTQKNQIVLIVVGFMLAGFVAVAIFLPSPPIPQRIPIQDARMPIPKGLSISNPRERGKRKAITAIQTHRTHIEGIQGHIGRLILLSGQSEEKRASLQHFQGKLSGELQKLYEIETAIVKKSKSPREIKKFMDDLRPSMKQMMGDLRQEVRK